LEAVVLLLLAALFLVSFVAEVAFPLAGCFVAAALELAFSVCAVTPAVPPKASIAPTATAT
jgi:hypothetical protein